MSELISRLNTLPNFNNVHRTFEGVGIPGNIIEFFLNGIFAQDLDNKIKEVYRFIVENYRGTHNNRVWLFGFSRGAYTVRSVAAMINNCGIIDESRINISDGMNLAYEIYRNGKNEYSPQGELARRFRNNYSWNESDNSIIFMGLWDTVGAHGLPSYGKKGLEYLELYDKVVSSHINYAYQAVAVHENIAMFEYCPILRREGAHNTVKEKWFPGIHIDIGGFTILFNNPVTDATLNWMINNINSVQQGLGGEIETIPPIALSMVRKFIIRITRWCVRLFHYITILSLIFRDRDIPFNSHNPTDVLYEQGRNWNNLADLHDYTSQAYNVFNLKRDYLAD